MPAIASAGTAVHHAGSPETPRRRRGPRLDRLVHRRRQTARPRLPERPPSIISRSRPSAPTLVSCPGSTRLGQSCCWSRQRRPSRPSFHRAGEHSCSLTCRGLE